VLVARLSGLIAVPGYAAIVLTIAFFAGLNMLGLGIIGAYVWRAFENTKSRPDSVIMSQLRFEGRRDALVRRAQSGTISDSSSR
jgi:nicotinamide riboside transporter PnuC